MEGGMISFENFDAMIQATMPKDLNEEEQAFFKKWYRKFHINNDMNTNKFIVFIKQKGIDKNSFRDRLYHFGSICYQNNNVNILKYAPPERKAFVNEQNNQGVLSNSIGFTLDEIQLTETIKSKKSCIKKAGSFATKLYCDYNYPRIDIIKMIAKYFIILEADDHDFIRNILTLATKLNLSDKEIEWLNKQKKKYEIEILS